MNTYEVEKVDVKGKNSCSYGGGYTEEDVKNFCIPRGYKLDKEFGTDTMRIYSRKGSRYFYTVTLQ